MSKLAGLFRAAAGEPDAGQVESSQPGDDQSLLPQGGFTLLFVDDEEGVLKALRRIFIDENYQILTASSGEGALQLLERHDVQLMITDHRMPGMTGAQLLRQVKERWPAMIRIMLTGFADVQSIMGAVNEGAVYKFITKPWNDEDLRLTVSLALQQYVLLQENRKLKEVNRKQQEKIKNYAARVADSSGILGTILTKAGQVTTADFDQARKLRQQGEFIIDTLVRLGLTTEVKVIRALQSHLHLDVVDLRELAIPPEVARFLPRELCEKSRIIPVRLQGRQLTLAMADPSDIFKIDNLALMTGFKVIPVIAGSAEIRAQLLKIYASAGPLPERDFGDVDEIEPIDEIDIVIEEDEFTVDVEELISSSEVPPIVRIVNAIISEAIRYQASDIHIEPKTKFTLVRFRIDGMLHDKIRIPAELHGATISRIKILGKLDISERRIPQDGRISVKSGTRLVDLRVSTLPSINGEKVGMRILDKSSAVKKIKELGLLGDDLQRVTALIKKPQGIIIATGPTGSGKTTMLYSLLGEMLDRSRNFETIEEPVEYFVEEANQISVLEKVGLSFASILRATLRQDPDVILVGEIRDKETADVAFKAALTGHMVLTTLHTNHSIASITRLIDIGIPPYLIASALEGIIAQRLVRRLCKHCKVEEAPDPEVLKMLRVSAESLGGRVFQAKGCPRCSDTGYLGRIGIYELFVMNEDYRGLISEGYKESKLLEMARLSGMKSLIEDGLSKVRYGETSLDELLRVIGPQIKNERLCSGCRREIDVKFLFCPYCGTFKQHVCRQCNMAMEEDWLTCAFCGHPRSST